MARKVSDIVTALDGAQAAQPGLSGLNSPSQAAIYTLWKYVFALCQNLLEQLIDIKKDEVDAIVENGFVGSDKWLQAQVFKFQYSAAVPQVIQLIDYVPSYPVIDPSLRIITRASVKTTGSRIVTVKVAKQEPPVALTTTELNSLKSYLSNTGNGTIAGIGIGFAGVKTNVASYDADKFYLKANISYNGQYSAVIQANVVSAIELYFANIPFDGNLRILNLVDYIQAVPGVADVVIQDAAIRADLTPFGSKTYLVQSFTELVSVYPTFAGYVVGETTAGNTLADTLTFIAQ